MSWFFTDLQELFGLQPTNLSNARCTKAHIERYLYYSKDANLFFFM